MKNNFKKAFSLVEISIVILVVGVLIAGISKGIDMVYDMRLVTARSLTDKAPVPNVEGLELWLETTSENSLAKGTTSFTNIKTPEDAQPIGRWNDLNPMALSSDYKNHAVQATSGYQPLYMQDGINGLPALLFDGVDDWFNARSGKSNFNEFTFFIVAKPQFNSISTYGNVINISCSGSASTCIKTSNSNGTYNFTFATNPSGWISLTVSNQKVLTLSYSMTSYITSFTGAGFSVSSAYDGDAVIATINQGSKNAAVEISPSYRYTNTSNLKFLNDPNSYLDFRIGKQKDGFSDRNFKGYLSEIILFGRSLDDQETKLIKNYLSEKWRIKI